MASTRDLSSEPLCRNKHSVAISVVVVVDVILVVIAQKVTLVWSNRLLQDLFATGPRSNEDLESLQQEQQKQPKLNV